MINSITKNRINEESLKTAVARALGEKPAQITELDEGMFNAVYKITLSRGENFVMKVAPSPRISLLHYEKDLIHTEILTLQLLKKKTTLPVPRVIYNCKQGEEFNGAPWFIMECLKGIPYNRAKKTLTPSEQDNISHSLGNYLSEMNSIRGPLFGYPGIPDEQSQMWEEAFPYMLEGIINDGRREKIPLPLAYDKIQRLAEKDYHALSEVTLPSLIHWDLWDGNVFIHEGKVSGIIDCERALWADPLMEQNFCHINGPSDPFYKGYGRGVPLTEGEKARRRLYDLYLFLIMVIETFYRKFEPNDQIKWSYPLLEKFLSAYPR